MAKSLPKTMRFDSDVENYINQFQGDNFSDKFHNLVKFFVSEEVNKKSIINVLDKEICLKQERLKNLNDMIFNVRHLEKNFRDLKQAIECAQGYLTHFLRHR